MLPIIALARFHKLLQLFDLGPSKTLRADMNRSNCIISGSAALYIFHPYAFTPADIDFYVPISSAVHFEFALFARGFTEIVDNGSHHTYPGDTIVSVVRLRKPGGTRTVNLIATCTFNPLAAVVEYHSTLVMNAITADGVISLYPLLTLAGRGVTASTTPSAERCFKKYMDRGFTLERHFQAHRCKETPYCRKTLRAITDDHTLSIPFSKKKAKFVKKKFGRFMWRLHREERS